MERVAEWKLLSEFPEITKNSVHIWKSDLPTYSGFDSKLLSAEELIRADRFLFESDKNRYFAAHLFLRRILSGYSGVEPDKMIFQSDDKGRPSLLSTDELPFSDFNLSYSRSMVAVAITSKSRIGIDIEKIDDDLFNIDIVERYFSGNETKAIKDSNPSERNEAFFRLWTGKEAFQKVQGGGLTIPLSSFSIERLLVDDTVELSYPDVSLTNSDMWKITHFVPANGFSGAVAYREQTTSLEFYEFGSNP